MTDRPHFAGPLLGAALIGCGVGYLFVKKTGVIWHGVLAAVGITLADLVIVLWTNKFKNRNK